MSDAGLIFFLQIDVRLWVLQRHSSSFFNLVGVALAVPADVVWLIFMCIGGSKGCPEGRFIVEVTLF